MLRFQKQLDRQTRSGRHHCRIGPRNLRPRGVSAQRAGVTIWEVSLTLLLISGALAVSVPTVRLWQIQQRNQSRQLLALQELNNQLEVWSTRPYAELTPEAAKSAEVPESVRQQLPDATFTLSITEAAGTPPGKRLQASLNWTRSTATTLPPLSLTTWVYAPVMETQP